MDFRVLIAFGIGLAVYFVGLGVFCLIKHLIHRKQVQKDLEKHKDEFCDGE